jgi:hypothetical protein
MEKKFKIVGIVGLIIVTMFIGWVFISLNTFQVDYNTLADCLTKKGVIMVGTDTCPACKNQKTLFGDAFEKINYKNCDIDGDWCSSMEIQSIPTWVFPDGTQSIGVKDAVFLSNAAGCNLE